jgi:hypothetical protein
MNIEPDHAVQRTDTEAKHWGLGIAMLSLSGVWFRA